MNTTTTLTTQSQKVNEAIIYLQECGGGIGPSLKELVDYTGMTASVLRGNISDLVQKQIVLVDLKADSGAACDMYYNYEAQ